MTCQAASPAMCLVCSVPASEEEEDTDDNNRECWVVLMTTQIPTTISDRSTCSVVQAGSRPNNSLRPSTGKSKPCSLCLPLYTNTVKLIQSGVLTTMICNKVSEAYDIILSLATILCKIRAILASGIGQRSW